VSQTVPHESKISSGGWVCGILGSTVSREDVEVVRRVYEAVAHRDAAAVFDLYHPDVVLDGTRLPESRLGGASTGLPARGHEGLRNLNRAWSEAWEHYEDRCEELIDAGDCVISVVTRLGRGRASKIDVSTSRAGVWTVRDDKVVEVVWFTSVDEARQAAGVPEETR
jgi:ketosteroid isomerase-like protein